MKVPEEEVHLSEGVALLFPSPTLDMKLEKPQMPVEVPGESDRGKTANGNKNERKHLMSLIERQRLFLVQRKEDREAWKSTGQLHCFSRVKPHYGCQFC
jgi:hypothetical protein